MAELKGKSLIIAGGSLEIGESASMLVARRAAHVTITDLSVREPLWR